MQVGHSRQTFIVTIRSGSGAVVENVATGERRPVENLSEIGAQIGAWQSGAQPQRPGTAGQNPGARDVRL